LIRGLLTSTAIAAPAVTVDYNAGRWLRPPLWPAWPAAMVRAAAHFSYRQHARRGAGDHL